MCGRYGQVTKVKVLEKHFNAKAAAATLFDLLPNFNVSPGQSAPVITGNGERIISLMTFGMTPFWAKKSMYLINARAEGDGNKEDDPNYSGGKGIISKPSFRKPIRSQRCLIPADYFMEGPQKEKLNKPYCIFLPVRPFAFAGIWDEWADPETGEMKKGFCIITAPSNSLLQMIGHHRSPVILSPSNYHSWLHEKTPLADATALLSPWPGEQMNGYPISPKIKMPGLNFKELIAPTGDLLRKETEFELVTELQLEGMGNTRARAKRNEQGKLF